MKGKKMGKNCYWLIYKDNHFSIFHETDATSIATIMYPSDYGKKAENKEVGILQPRFREEKDALSTLYVIDAIGHRKAFKLLKKLPTWFFDGFKLREMKE